MAAQNPLDAYTSASQCSRGYLDFARIGPLLAPVSRARTEAAALLAEQPERLDELDPLLKRTRALGADLLGFDVEQVAISPNTSTALFQAAFALRAEEVLVSPFDFPANTYPWLRAAERGGPRVRWLVAPDSGRPLVTPELVAEALTPAVGAVSVSAVDFASGQRVDLEGIREVIGDRILIVDAIQALGALDLPWGAADVVASGGQKWMRAGWGTGLLACSSRALDVMGPGLSGWSGTEASSDPRSLPRLAQPMNEVGRFSITPPDMIALAGFAAALECVLAAGITGLSDRVEQLAARARHGLAQAGATLHSPAAEQFSSGIISFTVKDRAPGLTAQALAEAGITVSEREGAVRASLHASTSTEAVDQLLDVVAKQRAGRTG